MLYFPYYLTIEADQFALLRGTTGITTGSGAYRLTIHGCLRLGRFASYAINRQNGTLRFESIVCSASGRTLHCGSDYDGVEGCLVCAYNCTGPSIYGPTLNIGEVIARGCYYRPVVQFAGSIGVLRVRDPSSSDWRIYAMSTGVLPRVGYIDSTTPPSSVGDYLFVGGPVSMWQLRKYGIADKVTGRGGTGYGLRITPSTSHTPIDVILSTITEASKSVTMTFYCYYSGTAGDVPPCWIELREPNGLAVARYDFSPPNGTDWSAATQQTITFDGTTVQAGSLQVAICVRDNEVGDAVVYIDDVQFTFS